jgi:hypothetical protein
MCFKTRRASIRDYTVLTYCQFFKTSGTLRQVLSPYLPLPIPMALKADEVTYFLQERNVPGRIENIQSVTKERR